MTVQNYTGQSTQIASSTNNVEQQLVVLQTQTMDSLCRFLPLAPVWLLEDIGTIIKAEGSKPGCTLLIAMIIG